MWGSLRESKIFVFSFIFAISFAFTGYSAVVPPGANLTPGPQPGNVFKDYNFTMNIWKFGVGKEHSVVIDDLKDAVKAELGVEYWGGHVGTSKQRLQINGHATKEVHYALPQNTPTRPECYHHQTWGNAHTEIPLAVLKEGSNTFKFLHSEQICYSWNWPQTLTYGLTFRIYYKPSKPHPTGSITSPKSGATIGDNATISASVTGAATTYFVGYYKDFDWEGNGLLTQWHWATQYGRMRDYIGKATGGSPRVVWKNSNVPDQMVPIKLAAILVDSKGYRYMTPAAENVTLKRSKGVSLFKPLRIPEFFCVRQGRTKKSCMLKLTRDIKKASKIEVIVSSWSCEAKHNGVVEKPGTGVYINGKLLLEGFGRFHGPSLDVFKIPQSFFKAGVNVCTFEVRSTTKEHACEINVPGPIIRAHFDTPEPPPAVREDYGPRGGSRLDMQALQGGFSYVVRDALPFRMDILDAQGRCVKSVEGKGPLGGKELMPVSRWAQGVYFGRIISGKHSLMQKVLVLGR